MTRTLQLSATETIALNAMRDAMATGWHTEALLVDAATQSLVKLGHDPATSEAVAQIVFTAKMKNHMGAG